MGRKINFFSYLRVDCVRVFSSWRFLVGIIGVCAVMYLASYEGIDTSTNVVYVVWLIVYGTKICVLAGCTRESYQLCHIKDNSCFPFSSDYNNDGNASLCKYPAVPDSMD